jgi:hypothetical protein
MTKLWVILDVAITQAPLSPFPESKQRKLSANTKKTMIVYYYIFSPNATYYTVFHPIFFMVYHHYLIKHELNPVALRL